MATLPPFVPPEEIEHLVDANSLARGAKYARDGRVINPDWNDEEHQIEALVMGTASTPYLVNVYLDVDEEENVGYPTAGDCTCPVRTNCKHVAATLCASNDLHRAEIVAGLAGSNGIITASQLRNTTSRLGHPEGESAGQFSSRYPGWNPGPPAPPEPAWRTRLRGFTRSTGPDPVITPLALGFELQSRPSYSRAYRYAKPTKPITARDILAGTIPTLQLRPLVPGKRDNWIKGNTKWSTVSGHRSSLNFNREQAEWFTLFHELYESSERGRYLIDDHINLQEFASPRLWRLLDWATEIDIPFIGFSAGLTVRLGASADFHFDARAGEESHAQSGQPPRQGDHSDDPDIRLRPVVTIDGTIYPQGRALPIEDHGFAGLTVTGKSTIDLVIAPSTTSAGTDLSTLRELLDDPTPIEVPARHIPEFLAEVYPKLSTATTLVSGDDSVEFPQLQPAQLLLTLDFDASTNSVSLAWSWLYHSPKRTFPLVRRYNEDRDSRRETAVLATVREIWPGIGTRPTEKLHGIDTAEFSLTVLPRLEELEEVCIEFAGERPEYKELVEPPHVKVTASDSASNDWFDLGIEITVEGTVIPFVDVFTALATGQDRLLLPDHSFLSLDHPAFEKLRNLLAEAEALSEWSPENPQISRYQAGLWAELDELANETVEAEQWQSSVRALSGIEPITEVAPPVGLQAQLRQYQLEGYRWLVFLWVHGLGGILADDMGLGKTIQTLALIEHARSSGGEAGVGTGTQGDAEAGDAQTRRPFLVVAPTSVVGNWRLEAEKFTPGLRVAVIDATTKKRKSSLDEEIAGADLVITSYAVLRLDAEAFGALDWAGLILDEAQFVKNSAARVHQVARSISAPFRLAITGTPMENSLNDLWSLTSITSPGLFPSKAKFREEFVKPIESGEAPEKMARLRARIKPFMLRRQKELVAAELPAKQEQVLTVELESRHRKLYDTVLQRERKKLLGLLGDMDKNRFAIFRSLTLLRMLALDPAIVDESPDEVPSSKLDALLDHLGDIVAEGHRTLVFSQFTSFLSRIASHLDERGIEHAYLDGSTRQRGKVIESFRKGSAPVFLISLKAGGFGLTLTEADYVFLMDPWWNPATEAQAIDRTHRIGQTKNVMVYRLVSEGTIEEKVVALQQKKAELFSTLMDNGEAFSSAITAADIRELLGE